MLIRTRLLLLALLPVPALLGLAVAVLSTERDQALASGQTVRMIALAEAAHQVAAAIYAERDVAAHIASADDRGLEALLIDAGPDAAVPKRAELVDRAAAVDQAAEALQVRAQQAGGMATALAARIFSGVQRLRPLADTPGPSEVVERYGEITQLLGSFGDEAGPGLEDPAALRGLRTLAVAERLQNHLDLQRIYVRHALLTRTLPPELGREFVANEGQKEEQQYELLEFLADSDIATGLRRVLDDADRRGRRALIGALQRFNSRQDLLGGLSQSLGYGGLIHNFKNFVLRGEDRYRDQAQARAKSALGQIEQLDRDAGLSAEEKADAKLVRTTVETYQARLATVADLWKRGATPAAVDKEARIEDEETFDALTRLSLFRSDIPASTWEELGSLIDAGVQDARARIASRVTQEAADTAASRMTSYYASAVTVVATLLALTVVAGFSYHRLSRGIGTLVGELQRVTRTGDVSVQPLLSGSDELSRINDALVATGRRLERVATVAEAMAAGNYGDDIEPLSERDRLAHAMRAFAVSARQVVAQAQAISKGDYETVVRPRSERDSLAVALADMAGALRRFRAGGERAQWLNERRLRVLEALRSPEQPTPLAVRVLDALMEVTGAPIGAFHARQPNGFVALVQRGIQEGRGMATAGLVDRALQLHRTHVFAPLPAGYLRLVSGVGDAELPAMTLTPLRAGVEAVGAIELGWLWAPDPPVVELLDAVGESIAVALTAANARARTETLLTESRAQSDRLERQQVELRQFNEELENQAQALRQSEEELKSQREELQTTNEELEEKGDLLERQRRELERTAQDLGQATRYKSEFLANMSHELRTPLNSLLILSRELAQNDSGNLDPDQVKSAEIIYEGGRDLLGLINDILDLSKVEAGKLEVHAETVSIKELLQSLRRQFTPVAAEKALELDIRSDADATQEIVTDRQRLEQILRNLLSNALKFTAKGRVTLEVFRPPAGLALQRLAAGDAAIAFAVQDTGIGIPADRLDAIFDAFRQADGSTSRRYGGTGLGLTIARQLAGLLGGEILVTSTPGTGSTFTVVLPATMPTAGASSDAGEPPPFVRTREPVGPRPAGGRGAGVVPPAAGAAGTESADAAEADDDRRHLKAGEHAILVIEDDRAFAIVMRDLIRRHGFKCLLAGDGRTGLALAREFGPSAIVLDLGLPDVDGLTVLETLKGAGTTRHIPVHIISAKDPGNEPLLRGAFGFVQKPAETEQLRDVLRRIEGLITRPQRVVLVVEDDRGSQLAIRTLLQNDLTEVVTVSTGAAALDLLNQRTVDCIVLDLTLPDTEGIEFLERLRGERGLGHIPVVIYTGRELSKAETLRLSELAQSIVIKGAASPERLLDEVVLFLHEMEDHLREDQKRIVSRLHGGPDAFVGRKLLLVDDDLRNTFALSGALKKFGFEVLIADNGQLALDRLAAHPDVDAVLMDVMMPVMDGIEATQRIREQARFRELPIIAVTARAMGEDRRRCLQAGASDYLSKPVDVDQLLAMLRIWLGRSR